jgi:hypothetical protein
VSVGGDGRRLVVVLLVAGLLALALGPLAHLRPRQAQTAVASLASPAPEVAAAAVRSSAWYCPGPLPVGATPYRSSVVFANTGGAAVAGTATVVSSTRRTLRLPLRIPAEGSLAVALPVAGVVGAAAVAVVLGAGGVAVGEAVRGAGEVLASPCEPDLVSGATVPGGSTSGGDDVELSLFNPGATSAVASVEVVTPRGASTPLAYQGLVVLPGHLAVLSLQSQVPGSSALAARVVATGGPLSVGALETANDGAVSGSALVLGEPVASTRWWFPTGPAWPGIVESLWLEDPDARSEQVILRASGPLASLELPSGGLAAPAVPASPVATTVRESPEWLVLRARTRRGSSGGCFGALVAVTSARRGPGLTVTLPVAGPAREWVLPVGGVGLGLDEVVRVTDPGRAPALVTIGILGGTTGSGSGVVTYPGLGPLRLAPGASELLDLGRLLPSSPLVSVVVQSSVPVLVGELLYDASGGIAMPDPLPVG